jgi:hypothetical protein
MNRIKNSVLVFDLTGLYMTGGLIVFSNPMSSVEIWILYFPKWRSIIEV